MKLAYSKAASLRTEPAKTALISAAPLTRGRWAQAALALWPALAVLSLAALSQANMWTTSDVSWLITLCEKMLGGQRPYVDFIENNPPAAFAIYMPGVLAARALGVSPEFMVGVCGFLAVLASLGLSALILARAGLTQGVEGFVLLVAVAVLALLPGHVFDQREHIALLAGLPMLAALAARVSGAPAGVGLSVLAGAGAALMASIKPYFALMILATLPYLLSRVGLRSLLGALELQAATFFGVLSIAIVVIFFPVFIDRIAPIAATVYAPVRQPWSVLAINVGVIAWAILGCYVTVFARGRSREPVIAILTLASLGAMATFFIQGKGWPYHAYPAIALMALSLGLAAAGAKKEQRNVAWAIVLALPIVAIADIFPGYVGALLTVTLISGAACLAVRILAERDGNWRAGASPITVLALAAIYALAGLLFLRDSDDFRALEAKVASAAPHPSVLALTQDIALGHPLIRHLQGSWAQRPNALWISHGAERLIKASGDDPALAKRLEPYLRLDRDMLVEDIERNKPDVVLIDNRARSYHDWAFADPQVAAALAPYRFYDADHVAHGEIEIYVRADLPTAR